MLLKWEGSREKWGEHRQAEGQGGGSCRSGRPGHLCPSGATCEEATQGILGPASWEELILISCGPDTVCCSVSVPQPALTLPVG